MTLTSPTASGGGEIVLAGEVDSRYVFGEPSIRTSFVLPGPPRMLAPLSLPVKRPHGGAAIGSRRVANQLEYIQRISGNRRHQIAVDDAALGRGGGIQQRSICDDGHSLGCRAKLQV